MIIKYYVYLNYKDTSNLGINVLTNILHLQPNYQLRSFSNSFAIH